MSASRLVSSAVVPWYHASVPEVCWPVPCVSTCALSRRTTRKSATAYRHTSVPKLPYHTQGT
eukprot:2308510-Rhodomonas_salina.1